MKKDEILNTVEFGPYAFILDDQNRTLFKCERGFFWAKDQAPEIVKTGRRDEWGPNKTLVHYRNEKSQLVPFRENSLQVSWKKSITYSSKVPFSKLVDSQKIIVDCRV
jgi:hypothetical protein